MITPVFDAPLLLVEGDERVLVAADLHLGLEYELWRGGVSIPSQTEKILARLLGFLAEIKPDRLLLLGDIKHNVPKTSWQEKREIPEFLRRLCAQVLVEIVPGNHDSNLADMAPLGVRVRPSSGFVLDGVGYFHGHTWPDEKVMRADSLVAGTWTWWNTSSSPFIRENAATHWDLKKAYQLTPHSGKVKATAPGRIHLTVLDMNRFAPNRPGGGGVGFALQIYCSAEVECTSSCLEIDYSREPIIRHFAEVFKKAVHYQGGFKIAIQDHERKHVGLGSTGSV